MSKFATAAATVPEPCRIFGTMLRPFCLGHHLLFKRLGLPFAGNPLADCGGDDIMQGIAICGGDSYETTLDQFHNGKWPRVFAAWTRQIEGPWWRRRKLSKAFLADAEELFRAYLADGYQRPPVWNYKNKDGIELSAPWELILKNRLVMGGYTESQMLNGYLPARWYDYYTISELNAASQCSDKKNWTKVFYTADDHRALHPEEYQ